MTVYKWDNAIPGNNDVIDSTINWQEGQSSATVNNSARGMMTAIAKYRDDIAGRTTTGGGTTAYTLTSNQGFTSLAAMNGAMVAFVMNVTSSTPVTLNVDSLGAKALRATPGVELSAGQLVAGTPYAATYFNGTNQWILQGVPDLSGVTTAVLPIGGVVQYAGNTAPASNFAMCNGQEISRSTYLTLFTLCSTSFGVGNGTTTFNVPDLRGRVAAGMDNMGSTTAQGRIITSLITDGGVINGQQLGSFGGSQSHQQLVGELAVHNHTINISESPHSHTLPATIGAQGGGTNVLSATGTGISTGTQSTGIGATSVNAGSSNAIALLQPTLIINSIIRIL